MAFFVPVSFRKTSFFRSISSTSFSVKAYGLFENLHSQRFITPFKNVFEEFAWRGFLTSKLIGLKVNDWLLYLISGLVWGLWHVPNYLVFLDAGIFEVLPVSRMGFALTAAIIMHATEDGVVMFLFAGGYYVFANNKNAWIFDPHIGVVATVFILGAGLLLRTIRIKTTP